jgi:CRP-like cAMP-binding protein
MVHDRIQGDDMRLTHEFLATMLGVRRAGVSVAMKTLEQHGLVGVSRGVITVIDRDGLERSSNGAYGEAERVSLSPEC